jgi:hypothetical protein
MNPKIHPYKKTSPLETEVLPDIREDSISELESFANMQRSRTIGRNTLLSEIDLLRLYVYAQPLANALDIVPVAATKSAPRVKILDQPEMTEELEEIANRMLRWALPVVREAIHLARLYGWAIIPIFTTETIDYTQKPSYVEGGGIVNDIRAVAGGVTQDATVVSANADTFSRNYGKPLSYRINPMLAEIHADRCILLTGIKDCRPIGQGGFRIGYSLLEPLAQPWLDYEKGMGSLLKILEAKSIEVFMIPNLKEILLNPKKLRLFLNGLKTCKTAINGYLIDSLGDFKLGDRSLTGINDAMSQLLKKISMQANLPDTLLFGISPDGLTSGSYESKVLDDLTATYQASELEGIYRQLLDTMFALLGKTELTYELIFKAPGLEDKVDVAQAERDKAESTLKVASALAAMVNEGLMKAEVAASIFAHAIDGVNPNVSMASIGDGDKTLLGKKTIKPAPASGSAPGINEIDEGEDAE